MILECVLNKAMLDFRLSRLFRAKGNPVYALNIVCLPCSKHINVISFPTYYTSQHVGNKFTCLSLVAVYRFGLYRKRLDDTDA